MANEGLERVCATMKEILGDTPEREMCVDEMAALWQRMTAEGMTPQDFSWSVYQFAMSIMMEFAQLDDARAFALDVRHSANKTQQIISEEWPPPDPEQWQWEPEAKG